MFKSVGTPPRVFLRCLHARCGLRTVSLPLSLYNRSHGVECDRCGLPMTLTTVSVGVDRNGSSIVWQDAPASDEERSGSLRVLCARLLRAAAV